MTFLVHDLKSPPTWVLYYSNPWIRSCESYCEVIYSIYIYGRFRVLRYFFLLIKYSLFSEWLDKVR